VFEKAVERKPLARRTRDLCKLNGASKECRSSRSRRGRWRRSRRTRCKDESMVEGSLGVDRRRSLGVTEAHFGETL
jgi:hypothetical protein